MLADTLASAWADCAALLGEDADFRRWGALHACVFAHALGATCRGAGAGFDVGPFAMGAATRRP